MRKVQYYFLFIGLLGFKSSAENLSLYAQETNLIISGTWVRVLASSITAEPIIGHILALETDTLVVKVENIMEVNRGSSVTMEWSTKTLIVPLFLVEKLEVSQSRVTRGRRLAPIIGLLGGAILGTFLGDRADDQGTATRAEKGNYFSILGGLFGATIGELLGLGILKENDKPWESVQLQENTVPYRYFRFTF